MRVCSARIYGAGEREKIGESRIKIRNYQFCEKQFRKHESYVFRDNIGGWKMAQLIVEREKSFNMYDDMFGRDNGRREFEMFEFSPAVN